jgi:beta propeller repeat protein
MINLTTGEVTDVATGPGDQVWADISEDRIVWMDNSSGNWDVVLYNISDGSTESLRKQGNQMYPKISGSLIAWQDDRSGNWDIYVYDLKTGNETKLTGDGDQVFPDVSGNTIVWEDRATGDIAYYIYDKKWSKRYPRPGMQTSPAVSGKYIAYVDDDGSLRRLDITTWKDDLIAAGPGQMKPDMDQKLVWLDSPRGKPRYESLVGEISVVCRAPGEQSRPAVSGNFVVWMDNRTGNPDIYVYDLFRNVEIPLAGGPLYDMYPDIRGTVIAWVGQNPQHDNWAVRTFDVITANRSQLTGAEFFTPSPISIGDKYLVWQDLSFAGWRLYKKLVYGGTEPVEAIPPSGTNPRTAGDIAVYQDNKDGNWNVYIWKGQQKNPVTLDPADQINPATDGYIVVYQDNRNGNWDIYAFDTNNSKEIRITSDTTDQTNPDIESGVIVWQDRRNGDWDIYAFDLSTGKEIPICIAPGDQTEPRIGSRKIVWTDNRSGDKDIYIYDSYSP